MQVCGTRIPTAEFTHSELVNKQACLKLNIQDND